MRARLWERAVSAGVATTCMCAHVKVYDVFEALEGLQLALCTLSKEPCIAHA